MAWDSVWEEVFKSQAWGRYPDESFIRFVARNFYKRNRALTALLEIGCGPGANVWYAAREGFKVSGIDGSATAIAQAKARLTQEGLVADLRVGDISQLPFADETFDAVADNECLAHNSRSALTGILAQVKRVLKPQGLLYSRTFTDDVYKGKDVEQVGEREFNRSSDGPFGGRGFFRLSNEADITALYGPFFKIISVDRIDYTMNNKSIKISEWVVVCQK